MIRQKHTWLTDDGLYLYSSFAPPPIYLFISQGRTLFLVTWGPPSTSSDWVSPPPYNVNVCILFVCWPELWWIAFLCPYPPLMSHVHRKYDRFIIAYQVVLPFRFVSNPSPWNNINRTPPRQWSIHLWETHTLVVDVVCGHWWTNGFCQRLFPVLSRPEWSMDKHFDGGLSLSILCQSESAQWRQSDVQRVLVTAGDLERMNWAHQSEGSRIGKALQGDPFNNKWLQEAMNILTTMID